MSWLRLCFESTLGEISLVSMVVNQVCKRLGIDEIVTYQIELCAVEAVTNAIRHAYQQQPGNEIALLIRFDPSRIELEISDRGESMGSQYIERLRNGSRVLEFDPSDMQSLPEGGMGLQIIHEVMDETSYSSDGGVNCLRLTKLLPCSLAD